MNPADLKAALEADPELRKTLLAGGALKSEVLSELVFWNVAIAFVVNVTASVAYDQVRKRLSEEGSLTKRDLAQLADLLQRKVEGYDPARVDTAIRAATSALEDQGIRANEEVIRQAVQAAGGSPPPEP